MTTSLLVAVAALLPAPYAVSSPGPTRDTLGENGDTALVTISGVESYESSGELLLTTVSVAGGPGFPVGLPMLLRGWLDDSRAVRPVEEVFAPTETEEQIEQRNQALDAAKFPLMRKAGPVLFDQFDKRYRESMKLIIEGARASASR